MLSRGPALNPLIFRHFLSLALLVAGGNVFALGLGELRGQTDLGDKLRLEVDVSGEGAAGLDASCFRLVSPVSSGDIPWLKKATLNLRKGTPPVLEIRSESPLREPILQLAVKIGCGHEISREYMLLASPPKEHTVPAVALPSVAVAERPAKPAATRADLPSARSGGFSEALSRPRSPKVVRPARASNLPDRLLLSAGEGGGEPSLRLSTELPLVRDDAREAKEAHRDMLRLEFKMLMALNTQATTQLEAAEKLRVMEAALGDLQQHSAALAEKTDEAKQDPKAVVPQEESPPVAKVEERAAPPLRAVVVSEEQSWWAEWSSLGYVLGGVLSLLGGVWLWRRYREREQQDAVLSLGMVEPLVDPRRDGESDEPADLSIEPMQKTPIQVDFELDLSQEVAPAPAVSPQPAMAADSVLSISATTVDEHFEANPVMELADIMLSFGRVKGAAQALQEYIDNSPQEALQPWIRLMDVYRMAGMRNEFEAVARNLNQNFNVEIQQWEPDQPTPNRHTLDLVLDETVEPVGQPMGPRPERLEDMSRIMAMVVELWAKGDVVGYLQQLLRDNRGGKRMGFSLPVVEEILFLIELKETLLRIEKEGATSSAGT